MGGFTRFRDIISSNIHAMLDRAEDPEKLIRLMIREMEDTLVELKAACAGVMANRKRFNARSTRPGPAKGFGKIGHGWQLKKSATIWPVKRFRKNAALPT